MKAKCSVHGCDRPVHYPKIQLCAACYQGFHYWLRKRSVRKMVSRAHQLEVLSARMEMLLGQKKVTHIHKRKRKVA